jgi:hypothetical protein
VWGVLVKEGRMNGGDKGEGIWLMGYIYIYTYIYIYIYKIE